MNNLLKTIIVTILLTVGITGCQTQRAKEEAEQILKDAKAQATQIITEAEQKANVLITNAEVNAKKRSEEIWLQYLQSKITGLQELSSSTNYVNMRYLKSFHLIGNTVYSTIYNANSYGSVTPRFDIILYDEYGVTTGQANVFWLLDSIEAGYEYREESTITGRVSDQASKYFRVVFQN
jgi:hypothetical protein